ncbi:MAG TPA: PEP/pyruvate-binding domain-containing protein [Pseudobdellovibrionaceae bacterium]|nr:PEP/pyruvate-binding domain-containing protein [Pseudobdellovibrionaceae bacterium]
MNRIFKSLILKAAVAGFALTGFAPAALAAAKVMNPGEAVGQLVYLSVDDVKNESDKYKSLSPLSIPVFAEMPLDMSVVAGAITLKQQNLLSHVQLKSRARHTPNLDISDLEGGWNNPMFSRFGDGAWVRLVLGADHSVLIEAATEAQAVEFYNKKKNTVVKLQSDVQTATIFRTEDLRSEDFIRVGSKAANYGELSRALNTASRTVVRPGFGIPFFYYQEFIDTNPKIKAAINSVLRDPLMNRVAKVSYREEKLKALRDLMQSEDAVVNEKLVDDLMSRFEQFRSNGIPRNMKLRSSTNSEDLPNFNGAGLYTSESYKPAKKGKEKSMDKKRESLKEALRIVWASVWNLRAFDERSYFRIPHAEVRMGVQVNPSFSTEDADGVVVTKNMSGDSRYPGTGVYIEVQRGDIHSVANPESGVKPQKILVLIDENDPLNQAKYDVKVLQNSNIADDMETVLPHDNPVPVITPDEIKDLTFQSLKAQRHLKPILDPENEKFSLDLEFKVDSGDTGSRQVYLKQARPYID